MFGTMLLFYPLSVSCFASDLAEIRQRGVLRHLGVSYANFVKPTPEGVSGLDVDLMRLFAQHLGVKYEWVQTTWSQVFTDLTGNLLISGDTAKNYSGKLPILGDVIANGLTILPWREKLVQYSIPTFPTGVWLLARADSPIKPISPSNNVELDIQNVKGLLKNRSVLAMKNTCLDPTLYGLGQTGADIRFYTSSENLDEVAPAVLDGVAEATLLDIPDALIALQKWQGEIKVIGPVSPHQYMGVAFAKDSPELLDEFNSFFKKIWADKTYKKMVEKHYPSVFVYLGDFFEGSREIIK